MRDTFLLTAGSPAVAMQVFVFRSTKDLDISGFADQPDGGKLPSQFAPWRAIGMSAVPTGSGSQNPIVEAIGQDGFYIVKSLVMR